MEDVDDGGARLQFVGDHVTRDFDDAALLRRDGHLEPLAQVRLQVVNAESGRGTCL